MSSGVSPPRGPVRDGARPILWPAIPVDPGPRAPAVRERDDRAASLEIVPLLPIEQREKFRIVESVDLAAYAPGAVDQSRIAAEVEQARADLARAEKRRARGERAMERVAAHQGCGGEEERGIAGASRDAFQDVSTAWSTAPRKSRSGRAPSNWTRSLITTFGTPITW